MKKISVEIQPQKNLEFSIIGNKGHLTEFLDVINKYREIKIINFQKASFERHNVLSSFTDKQRETTLIAKKNGYYDYPRAINYFQLSEKMEICKTTAIEHIRKTEKCLIPQILIGY